MPSFYHLPRYGLATLATSLMAIGQAELRAGTVTVGATATGGFGRSSGFAGGRSSGSSPLVIGWTFTGAGQSITIAASGSVTIAPGDSTGPDGIAVTIDNVVAGPNSFSPLVQEAVILGTLTLPRSGAIPNSGALMGAFVPASTAMNPDFVAADPATLVSPQLGLDPSSLFFVGGSDIFTAPGAGTLYLGIDECFPPNNTGSFSVALSAVPEPGGLAMVLWAGVCIAIGALARLHVEERRSSSV